MAVAMPERGESWTDERLDDLSNRVDAGFARMDERFDRFEARLDARFDRFEARLDKRFETMDKRFERIDARFESVDARFDSLYHAIIVVGGGMIGTLIAACAAVIATRI